MKKILLAFFFILGSIPMNTNTMATANSLAESPIPGIQRLCYNYSVAAADLEWNHFNSSTPDHNDQEWVSAQQNYMIMCIRSMKNGEEILLPVFVDL